MRGNESALRVSCRWRQSLRWSTGGRCSYNQKYECQPRHHFRCQNQTVNYCSYLIDPVNFDVLSRREYRSEYKQRFRPFSQYEYLGDGRFIPSPNGQITPPTATKSSSSAKLQQQQQQQQQKQEHQIAMQQKATSLQGEPWYREVVELRRQANDYKVKKAVNFFARFTDFFHFYCPFISIMTNWSE